MSIRERYSLPRKEAIRLLVLPTAIVLIAFLIVTLWSWNSARTTLRKEVEQTTGQQVAKTEDTIIQRLRVYEDFLRGGVGLFRASTNVTREDWQRFVSSFDIQNRYPGIRAVGFAKALTPENIPTHEQEQRAQGIPEYRLYPAGERDFYTAVTYLEPLDERNRPALGLDMYAEPIRQEAMAEARDTGNTVITKIVKLAPNNGTDELQPGFIMYMPLYAGDTVADNIPGRRAALQGFIYGVFRSNDLFTATFGAKEDNLKHFEIYVDTDSPENLLYASPTGTTRDHAYELTSDIPLVGATWHIKHSISEDIIPTLQRYRPISVLFWGTLASITITIFVYRLLLNRATSLARAQAEEVQLAKDDLLSLASHQLRTPATGVKQYMGMVLEGYVGKLNAQQRDFLNKAYASNERQLHIINELLYVAKADSGRIVLSKQPINLHKLIKEIVAEHKDTLKDHQHKLTVTLPTRDITINADLHTLRMAIENLLSNAIKYTPAPGKISIRTRVKAGEAYIAIKDNGVGIPETELTLLFRQFMRIPNTMSESVSGTGVGLYLAEHLVKLHGGSIEVESQPNRGSTFTIVLPLNDEA